MFWTFKLRFDEDILAILAIFGHFWPFWGILGHFGPFWAIFGHFGHFWQFLAIFGNFWPFLAIFGHFWQFVAIFGNFWQFLSIFGLATVLATFKIWANIFFHSYGHSEWKNSDSYANKLCHCRRA